MLIALVIAYLTASALVTMVLAAFLSRTRKHVDNNLHVLARDMQEMTAERDEELPRAA